MFHKFCFWSHGFLNYFLCLCFASSVILFELYCLHNCFRYFGSVKLNFYWSWYLIKTCYKFSGDLDGRPSLLILVITSDQIKDTPCGTRVPAYQTVTLVIFAGYITLAVQAWKIQHLAYPYIQKRFIFIKKYFTLSFFWKCPTYDHI